MKLPKYDNDQTGKAGYYRNRVRSAWDDVRFRVLSIGLPIVLIVCIGAMIFGLFGVVRSLYHSTQIPLL